MASILDRYGIKEVADVTFYTINKDTGRPEVPVLFLDTLKVSTIEQTAEQVDARGGKGNPKLITWDYGKEITVTIEDALFSPKSMNILFGKEGANLTKTAQWVEKVAPIKLQASGALPGYITVEVYDSEHGFVRKKVATDGTPTTDEVAFPSYMALNGVYLEDGTELKTDGNTINTTAAWASYAPSSDNAYKRAYVKYKTSANRADIVITGDSFPGTYYITGDTYARSDVDGSDQFFQFIIPKAKVSSEQTITLEAEGDPTTFNMNLTVLRPDNGEMMRLVQYDLINSPASAG